VPISWPPRRQFSADSGARDGDWYTWAPVLARRRLPAMRPTRLADERIAVVSDELDLATRAEPFLLTLLFKRCSSVCGHERILARSYDCSYRSFE